MSDVPKNVECTTYQVVGFSRQTDSWQPLGPRATTPDSPTLIGELELWQAHHNPVVWDSEFKIVKRTEIIRYEEVDEHAKALGT